MANLAQLVWKGTLQVVRAPKRGAGADDVDDGTSAFAADPQAYAEGLFSKGVPWQRYIDETHAVKLDAFFGRADDAVILFVFVVSGGKWSRRSITSDEWWTRKHRADETVMHPFYHNSHKLSPEIAEVKDFADAYLSIFPCHPTCTHGHEACLQEHERRSQDGVGDVRTFFVSTTGKYTDLQSVKTLLFDAGRPTVRTLSKGGAGAGAGAASASSSSAGASAGAGGGAGAGVVSAPPREPPDGRDDDIASLRAALREAERARQTAESARARAEERAEEEKSRARDARDAAKAVEERARAAEKRVAGLQEAYSTMLSMCSKCDKELSELKAEMAKQKELDAKVEPYRKLFLGDRDAFIAQRMEKDAEIARLEREVDELREALQSRRAGAGRRGRSMSVENEAGDAGTEGLATRRTTPRRVGAAAAGPVGAGAGAGAGADAGAGAGAGSSSSSLLLLGKPPLPRPGAPSPAPRAGGAGSTASDNEPLAASSSSAGTGAGSSTPGRKRPGTPAAEDKAGGEGGHTDKKRR
jgi:hypothetical protein